MHKYSKIAEKYVDYEVVSDQEINLLDEKGNVLDTLYIEGLVRNFIEDMVSLEKKEEAKKKG